MATRPKTSPSGGRGDPPPILQVVRGQAITPILQRHRGHRKHAFLRRQPKSARNLLPSLEIVYVRLNFLLIKNCCKKKITAERMAQGGQKEKTLGVVLSTPMTWPEPQRSCARRCREKCRKAEGPTRADLGPSALHLLISNGARSRKTSAGRFPISNYDKARAKFGSPVSRKRWEDPSWLH